MDLHEMSHGLLVKQTQQAQQSKRISHARMRGTYHLLGKLRESMRKKNDKAHVINSAGQVREEAAASAAKFRLSPGLLCLMPSLAVLLQSLASTGPRGGVTKQVAAILGVGSGKQDKSKGGYSDLNVKDSTL